MDMSFRSLASVAVVGLLLPVSQALAVASIEPQVLALITTGGAKALNCTGNTCVAEFSAFCMEPGRPGPAHASPYTLAKGGAVKLFARSSDGRQWQIPISGARFTSQRGYSAVRISVPKNLIAKIGANSLAIDIGRHVVLLPKRQAHYVQLHKKREIKAALGDNRLVGERIVDNGGRRADGARLLSYLINALPTTGKASRQVQQSLWSASKAAPASLRAKGARVAKAIYKHCLKEQTGGEKNSIRECLQHGHDRNMWLLNQIYWRSVGSRS
jgi:hypothetical protein